MNSKKAKFLRKQAESITIGTDKAAYTSKITKVVEKLIKTDLKGKSKPLVREVDRTTITLQTPVLERSIKP